MEAIVYIFRCIIVILFSWFCVRLIGKKSISQLTSYDFTILMLLANVAAEPLVYKISSKAFVGSLTLAIGAIVIGYISLNKKFYNFDSKPEMVIINGKIDKSVLRNNRMNLPFLMSLLRLQGYNRLSDVEFAIVEPNGNLSVIPTSQSRPVTPNDLKIDTLYEGVSLPLVIDGEIQYNNLSYANLDIMWLKNEMQKINITSAEEVFLAEIDTSGKLSVVGYNDTESSKPELF